MLRVLASLAFPAACPGCGCPAEPVCDSCAAMLRPAPAGPPPVGVDLVVAPFAYAGVARELVARVKYRNARAALSWLADAVARECGRLPPSPVPVVTWAPTTLAHRRERGFDHAELLARAVARRVGAPARGLLGRRPGPPQTGRRASDRIEGPRFALSGPLWSPSVLLIDDVMTTGATLRAAGATLRRAGAANVWGAVVARTPAPGPARP